MLAGNHGKLSQFSFFLHPALPPSPTPPWQKPAQPICQPDISIDWTDPDHGERVLHEEVEDEGDEADEGEDGDSNHFLLVSSVQFILSDAPDNHQVKYYQESRGLQTYSISSLSSLRTFRSCIMYSVMELKYFRALWMSLEPLSRSRALFRMTLSLGVVTVEHYY